MAGSWPLRRSIESGKSVVVTRVACCPGWCRGTGGTVARQAARACGARAAAGDRARRPRRRPRRARRPRRRQDRAARVRGRGGPRIFASCGPRASEGEMELDYAALQQLCSPILELIERLPTLSVTRSASPSGSAPDSRRARSWSRSRCSVSSPKPPSSSRCCAWSTTRNGSTAHRLERSRSWRAACWRRGSRSPSGPATWATGWPASRSSASSRWAAGMHGRCWSLSSRRGWTNRARADHRRDRRESARAAGAPARADARPARRRASGCLQRFLCPPGSSRASLGGWRGFRATRAGCCSWRRQNRSATLRCCGVRRSSLGSRKRPHTPWSRKAC